MSAVKDAVEAVRQVLQLTHEVKAAGDKLGKLAEELRVHDRRLTTLEVRWETAMDFARLTRQIGSDKG